MTNTSHSHKKPDFFLVGAPKCGTTSMCHYLDQHPEIFIPAIKEPHFFASDLLLSRYCQNTEEYLALFHKGHGLLCGEGSVFNLFSQKAAQEIYEFNANAKIIIMLRNPIDVMYSLHSELLSGKNESIDDFEQALQAEDERSVGKKIPPGCSYPSALLYTNIATFTPQIQRYIDVFGRERMHVIIYDDFRSYTRKVYKETLDFLCCSTDFSPEMKVINPNKVLRDNRLSSLAKLHIPILIRLLGKRLLPIELRMFIRKMRQNITTYSQPRPPLDVKLRKLLQEQFVPEVERLSTLLNRDLTHWSRE